MFHAPPLNIPTPTLVPAPLLGDTRELWGREWAPPHPTGNRAWHSSSLLHGVRLDYVLCCHVARKVEKALINHDIVFCFVRTPW